MKKKTLKSIACAVVMALALSVTACGGSKDAAKTNEDTNTVGTEDAEAETEDVAEPETDTAAEPEADAAVEPETDSSADSTEGSYSTLEDYYNDPSVKSVLDSSFERMGQDGMTLSIEVKGNVLTMICQFEDSSVNTDEVKDALSTALDEQSATFETIVASFDESIGADAGTCTYIVRYTDPDDNVLAEKEFKAQ